MAPDPTGNSPDAFDGRAYARRLPTGPGVYVMRNERGEPLYVGKAANLTLFRWRDRMKVTHTILNGVVVHKRW